MDSQSELSTLESVDENDLNPENSFHLAVNHVKSNGSCNVNEDHKLSSGNDVGGPLSLDNYRGKCVESVQPVNSPPLRGIKPPATKGYGLKKWRRLQRDFVKDGSCSVDSSKFLKRGLSSSVNANPIKALRLPSEIKTNNEGSIRSATVLKNPGVLGGLALHNSSSDFMFAIGSAFAAGPDSENSGDRSSKSSTAASGPKMKYNLPPNIGYTWESNRIKNLSGKILGISIGQGQKVKVRIERSKKPRGDRIKIEKENSHSSVESDSRSSNFVFMQGEFSATSNGKHSRQSMNDDGADGKKAHDRERQSSEEVETGFRVLNEDISRADSAADLNLNGKEEKVENKGFSDDKDPLEDSILNLHSLQEALENEVQKFGEVGMNITSLLDHPRDQTQVLSLTEDIKLLESKLQETQDVLVAKDCRIAELEANVTSGKLPEEECASNIDLQQKEYEKTETQLEFLFRQRIEAEVEYLALIKKVQELRVAASDHSNLVNEHIFFTREQVQTMEKLKAVESKANVLRKEAKELEKHCESVTEMDEILKMQRRVCKVTSCFLIQLCLLVLVLWFLILQLIPLSGDVVPT